MERCDFCGPLEWTVNAYGQITHTHDCPNKTEDRCQAHPRGCEEAPSPIAFEWRYSSGPLPMDVGLPCGVDE